MEFGPWPCPVKGCDYKVNPIWTAEEALAFLSTHHDTWHTTLEEREKSNASQDVHP